MKAHRILIAAAFLAGPLAWASAGHADTILVFGQTSNTNTVIGTANGAGTSTEITGTNVAVSITQILGAVTTPQAAFLNFTFDSVGAAALAPSPPFSAGTVGQSFSGSFTITAGMGGGGTNFLSGTFTDAALGNGTSLILASADPSDHITFTSSVISELSNPVALAFGFTNVTPGITLDGSTISSFTSNISGNMSANPVPEPGTLSLLGTGLIGLGFLLRRGKKAA